MEGQKKQNNYGIKYCGWPELNISLGNFSFIPNPKEQVRKSNQNRKKKLN
jgi:hypothetical protein